MDTTLTPGQRATIGVLAYEFLNNATDSGRTTILLALNALDGQSLDGLRTDGRQLLTTLVDQELNDVLSGRASTGDPERDLEYAGELGELAQALQTLQVAEAHA